MSTPKITVITVNYNSATYTKHLINSVCEYIPKFVKEIIIIDNNSKEADKKELKKNEQKSKIIFNSENVGFSRAVNQGISLAKTDYLLLLNPDCVLVDSSISKLIKLINEDRTVGACGGKLIDPLTNQVVPSANRKPTFFTGLFEFTNLKKMFPNNVFTNYFWVEKTPNNIQRINVSSLCGAFVLFRKTIQNQEISFDNSYFMYLEDVQFGVDINKMGSVVVFDPNVRIIHHGGKSNNSKYKTVLKYWYNSRKIYFKKNLPYLQGKILEVIFTLEELFLKIYHLLLNTPNE